MISFEAGLFGLGGLLMIGPAHRRPVEHHGVMLGAAAGILFGVSDTAIKALTGHRRRPRAARAAAEPLAGGRRARVGRRLLRLGPRPAGRRSGPVIAVTGTAANIAGIAGGIVVFGDPMAAGPLGWSRGARVRARGRRRRADAGAGARAGPASSHVAGPLSAASILRPMPTTSQLVRKGRVAPKKKLATPGLKSGQGPQKEGCRPSASRRLHARVHDDPEEA